MHHHLHTFPDSSPVIQPRSLTRFLSQSVSQSVSRSVNSSLSFAFITCLRRLHTFDLPLPRPDLTRFSLNIIRSQRKKSERVKKIDVDGFWHLHRRLAPCHCAEKLACPTDCEAHFNEEWYVATAISRTPLYITSDHSTLRHTSPYQTPSDHSSRKHTGHTTTSTDSFRGFELAFSCRRAKSTSFRSDLKLFLLLFYQHFCSRPERPEQEENKMNSILHKFIGKIWQKFDLAVPIGLATI